MFSNHFKIANTQIGIDKPAYFIAEIGSNFDGSLSRAKDLIYLAKEAGANAAKFQHYTADTLVSDIGFRALGDQLGHQKLWNGSVYEIYRKASLNRDWTSELAETCKKADIHFMTSPYSIELVDFVDEYVPAFKIGSGDITWPTIIDAISKKDKPVLLASGASNFEDVLRAVRIIEKNNSELVLMQCNTNYTTNKNNHKHQNLRVLEQYKQLFPNVILGLSDHTQGDLAVLGAYALGARVFEKHFTDDPARHGPDHEFATSPKEFKDMISKTMDLEEILGSRNKIIEPNEAETVVVQRRSLHASRDINPGEALIASDMEYLRPCPKGSIPPYLSESIIGKRARVALAKGQTIKISDIE